MKFILALVMILSIFLSAGNSQDLSSDIKNSNFNYLKSEILSINSPDQEIRLNRAPTKSKKSPGLAVLFSLILPGAGHYYIDRMDVGKYFFGADVASWLGYATVDVYGNNVNDDAVTYSVEHAKVTNPDSKDDDYYGNVGNYNNIYEYNNEQLATGQYGSLYDVNQYYWDWDNANNRNIFESQRKSSQRILNTRIVFGSILIANRIVSGISAYLLAGKENKKNSALNIQPELLYKKDYSFDGVKINLSKNF